jgi:hypothetical protein
MKEKKRTRLDEHAKHLRDNAFNPETLRVAILNGLDTKILKKFIDEVERLRESQTESDPNKRALH